MGQPNSQLVNMVTGQMEAQRTPTTRKNALATTVAATSIWIPGAGSKRFRLMEIDISCGANAGLAAAGTISITLLDGATPIGLAWLVSLPTAPGAGTGTVQIASLQLLGNGYLSITPGNALNIALGAAVTSGAINVNVGGCEE